MNQVPPERSRKNLAALQIGMITLLVGMVDGAGLLTSGVFVSFMSGNTTTAAVSLTKGEPLKGSILLLTILLYVFGNFAGELIATASGHRASITALALAAAFIWFAVSLAEVDPQFLSLASLVFAMGLLNTAVDKAAGIRVGLTYVTGALSKIGIGAARLITGRKRSGFAVSINLVPWLGVFIGAGMSSLLFRFLPDLLLVVPASYAILLTLIMVFLPTQTET